VQGSAAFNMVNPEVNQDGLLRPEFPRAS